MARDTSDVDLSKCISDIAEVVEDAAEETFQLFSQTLPSNDLGILNPKDVFVEIDVAGQQYIIKQSSGLLRSDREGGTTGAALWKVTPMIAGWLADRTTVLWSKGILTPSSNVVELGCGIAGLIGLTLHSFVMTYILTDQSYVMKLLKENLATNDKSAKKAKRKEQSQRIRDTSVANNLKLLTFDWEQDSAENLRDMLPADTGVDLVLICDCVYNIYLIDPLVQACVDICRLESAKRSQTVLLIAQQLRTDAVFEEWMSALLSHFHVWRMTDDVLPLELQSNSGYTVHVAIYK